MSRCLVGVLCGVLLVGPVLGCRPSSEGQGKGAKSKPRKEHHPILLIGLDGVEWDVVLPMLRQGRLPNLANLMQGGSFGELTSIRPTSSPIIWTSIATGKTPQKHGILGFVHPRRGPDGMQKLFTSNHRRTKAFWNILTDLGLRVTVIGWWMTFPVEEINGVMVAQVNTSTPERNQAGQGIWKGSLVPDLKGQVHPPERQEEILSIVPQVEADLPMLLIGIFGEFSDSLGPVAQRLWKACTWAFRADATYHQVALKLLREDTDFDIFTVYFGGSDLAGHRFWRYMQPELYRVKPAEDETSDLGEVIWEYYAYLDQVVGELVEAAPADCVVMVVSDHGMAPINLDKRYALEDLTRHLISAGHWHAPPGLFVACGPNIRRNQIGKPIAQLTRADLPTVGSVFDVLPTLFGLLKIPSARDMDGSVMEEIIEPDYLARSPMPLVDTYTPPGWHENRIKSNVQSINLQERLEQLRTLGYIAEEGQEEPDEYNATPSVYEDEYGG